MMLNETEKQVSLDFEADLHKFARRWLKNCETLILHPSTVMSYGFMWKTAKLIALAAIETNRDEDERALRVQLAASILAELSESIYRETQEKYNELKVARGHQG